MCWKKLPYWLKVGLVFVAIDILLMLIYGLFLGGWSGDFSRYGDYLMVNAIAQVPGEILLSPTKVIPECIYQSLPGEDYSWCPKRATIDFMLYLSTLVFYFIVGMLVGLIAKKIKDKRG